MSSSDNNDASSHTRNGADVTFVRPLTNGDLLRNQSGAAGPAYDAVSSFQATVVNAPIATTTTTTMFPSMTTFPSDYPSTTHVPIDVDLSSESHHTLTYVLVVTAIVILVIVAIVFLILYLVKRNKLDRIRHHLMPLYNFDPTDEEPHWETDLLEDDREQQMVLNIASSTNHPKLKFHSLAMDI